MPFACLGVSDIQSDLSLKKTVRALRREKRYRRKEQEIQNKLLAFESGELRTTDAKSSYKG